MTDFDTIWRTMDETTEQREPSELARRWLSRDGVRKNFKFQIRTVVNAVLGECIWNLSYNE